MTEAAASTHVHIEASVYVSAFCDGLRPDPDLTITQWSDTYRMLPRRSSVEHGKYRSSRMPYLVEIMDALSPFSPVEEICFMKPTQIGATEVGNNWIFYTVDVAPAPMMMVLPTVELAKDHSKQKLAPSIEDMPRLQGKVRENRARDSGNTIQVKEFPGGILFLTGANSAAGFRTKSIRNLFLDDVDGYESDVGGEGDPCDLARKRTDAFGRRAKVYEVSTPTTKGVSRIERSFNDSDQRYYFVPCPYCGAEQRLLWGGKGADFGIKFERDDDGQVVEVWYLCRHCQERIDEGAKTEMLARGRWIPTKPGHRRRGYHLSSLYSPLGFVSWWKVVQEFLEAEGSQQKLKTWTNTRLGEPFEEKGEQPDWVSLKARCEPYHMLTVPAGAQILTAGVDTQKDRLAVSVYGWGRGEESWLVYWIELWGDPNQDASVSGSPWAQLDELLNMQYLRPDGEARQIVAAGVDTQGHHTQAVYNYCRNRSPRVFALQGASKRGRPVIGRPTSQDVTWRGKIIKGGVQLWPVGTDTAKSAIYSRLQQESRGPGYIHFPAETPDDFFRQLTAEKQVTRFSKGFPVLEWVKGEERNEGLDCTVYAYAAAVRIGISHMDWDKLEAGPGVQPGPNRSAGQERKAEAKQGGWLPSTDGAGWLNRRR